MATETGYPAPDRSDCPPGSDAGVKEVGWAEGTFSDERPWRAEMWAEDQVCVLTFSFSTKGLEGASKDDLANLLEREGVIGFTTPQRYASCTKFFDPSDNEMWSVNVVVGDDEDTFIEGGPIIRRYLADSFASKPPEA